MSSTSKTVARNSLFVLISRIVDTGCALLIITLSARYLIKYFDININGQYAYLVTLIGLVFTLSNAGLAQIIIRDVAKNKSMAPSYLRSAIELRFILGSISTLIILFLALYLPITHKMRLGILIAVVSEMTNVFSSNYINLFNAYERMDFEASATFIFRGISLVLTLLVIWLHLDWFYLFAATAIGNFARTFYVLWLSRRIVTHYPKREGALMKVVFLQALPIGIALLLTQGYLRIDVFVIRGLSAVGDYKEVAYFYYPYLVLLQLNILPLALTTALFPVMARAAQSNGSNGETSGIESIFIPTFKLYFILSLPIMIFGYLYATPIMTLIFTDAFARSGTCLQIMIWGTFFVFVELLMSHSLIATGHQQALFFANGTCLAVNFTVDYILIKYFHLGAIGGSIGTMSAYAALFLVLLYFVSQTVSVRKMVQQIPRPLIAGVLCGLVFYPLRGYLWYLMIPLGLLVYIAILFIIRTFNEKEMNMFRSLLRPPGPIRT